MRRWLALCLMAPLLLAAGDPPPTPPEEETEHVVQPGETLSEIARRVRVPRVLIAEANGLAEPYVIRPGQKLLIPRTRHYPVARGDTGFLIAYKNAVPWPQIALANNIDPAAPLRPGQKLLIPTLIPPREEAAPAAPPGPGPQPAATPRPAASRFAWPLAGPIRRGFAPRGQGNRHDGLDITAREGTAARASAAGTVIFAGEERSQFGRLVIVDHGGGWTTAYGFLSRITVRQDDPVRAGERVGLVGHTGLARGSELHFEVRREEVPVDPERHLPQRERD